MIFSQSKKLLLIILIGSCADNSQAPKQPEKTTSQGTESKFGPSSFSLNKPTVNGASLKVLNISVAKVKNGEVWQGSMSIEATGDADYVQFKACHQDSKECEEGKSSVDRVTLKPFPMGKVYITAKACADASRVSNSTQCGEEYSGAEFLQPENINEEISEFAALKANKIAQIEDYAKVLKQTLENFNKELEKCVANDAELKKLTAMRKTVLGYIALGEPLITKSITGYFDEKTKEVKDLGDKDAKPVNKTDTSPALDYAKKGVDFLKDVTGFKDMESLYQSFGATTVIKPVNAFQTLGAVVFDLFTAKDNVKRTCYAEENTTREVTRIKAQVKILVDQIKDLDAKIASGGL